MGNLNLQCNITTQWFTRIIFESIRAPSTQNIIYEWQRSLNRATPVKSSPCCLHLAYYISSESNSVLQNTVTLPPKSCRENLVLSAVNSWEREVKLFPGRNVVVNDTIKEQGLGFRFGYHSCSTRDRRNRLFSSQSFLNCFVFLDFRLVSVDVFR